MEHFHEQHIVPNAVGAALVLAHDPNPAEAHPFISADCSCVVGRWIDREAMMAALLEEIPGENPTASVPKPWPWRDVARKMSMPAWRYIGSFSSWY